MGRIGKAYSYPARSASPRSDPTSSRPWAGTHHHQCRWLHWARAADRFANQQR